MGSSCQTSKSPGAGPDAGAPCVGPAPCPKPPPSPPPAPAPPPVVAHVDIEINDTPAINDDIVQVKCQHPNHRHTVPCRIRLVAPLPPNAVTVVLTNPDGRLRFPNDADTTRTLSLPADGSWVVFDISGESGSNAIGDAKIEVHQDTAAGPTRLTKDATVFWFDQAQINVTAGGNYTLTGGRYTVAGAHAVDYSAQARIRPAGVDCATPQVRDLRVAIMQNTRPPRLRTINWDSPTITWNPGVAAGTTVTVPSAMRLTINVTVAANDSEASVSPLYDQPGKAGTLDPNSMKPPIGCAGGGAVTSFDTPSLPATPTLTVPATTAAGVNVGMVVYTFRNVTHRDNFVTWAVIFNTATSAICALRERTWSTDLDSSRATPQQATPAASDTAPTSDPLTGLPFSNTLSNDPANRSTGPVGAATTTFTK